MFPRRHILTPLANAIPFSFRIRPGASPFVVTFSNLGEANDLMFSIDDQVTYQNVAPGAELVLPEVSADAYVWIKASSGEVLWTITASPIVVEA